MPCRFGTAILGGGVISAVACVAHNPLGRSSPGTSSGPGDSTKHAAGSLPGARVPINRVNIFPIGIPQGDKPACLEANDAGASRGSGFPLSDLAAAGVGGQAATAQSP